MPDERAAAEELLISTVRIASVSRDEGRVADHLRERMQALGYRAHVDGAGNVVGVIGDGALEVAMVGHIDTVPGDLPVEVRDGALYGRGSVDAKGPFVSFVVAGARAVARCPGLRLRVIGCVEEEVASSRGARFLVDEPAPDALIIGEPSGWDGITLGYKGYLRAAVKLAGDCAHSAHDEPTVAAQAARLWTAIEAAATDFDAGAERAFQRLIPALLHMECASDGVRQTARLDLSLRLPPRLGPEAATAWLQEVAQGAEMQTSGGMPAWTGPRTTFLHRALARGIRAKGGSPTWKQKTGTADLNVLAPAWGCPALAYGPGDAALDHRPDEHIVLDEFATGIEVLELALEQCVAAGLAT